MTDDADLLEHYLRRGREASNVSLEAAWLEYELRAYVLAHLPKRRPLAVCNVGIGNGLWDDWLGHVVGTPITSIDRDPEVCRLFALRQRREGHPFPAEVLCGDPAERVVDGRRFDVITCIRSADRGRTQRALEHLLVPGGLLLVAEVGQGAAADRVRTCGDVWLACSARTCPT